MGVHVHTPNTLRLLLRGITALTVFLRLVYACDRDKQGLRLAELLEGDGAGKEEQELSGMANAVNRFVRESARMEAGRLAKLIGRARRNMHGGTKR